jgi:ferredoxin-NADP reductase
VTAVRAETVEGRSIRLDVPGWGGNLAGQHLDLRLTAPDGYTAVRSYSIATAGDGESIQLAVDRVRDGEVSPYLVDDLMIGDQLEVKGPLGTWFVWRPEPPGTGQTEPVQLIGAGSGIVPLLAMIRLHKATGSTAKFRLLYSVRAPEDAHFADELLAEHPLLEVTWVYTRKPPEGWPTPAGRVTKEIIEAATFASTQNPLVFVCGPTGFVESVATVMVELGHDPATVKTERFGGL